VTNYQSTIINLLCCSIFVLTVVAQSSHFSDVNSMMSKSISYNKTTILVILPSGADFFDCRFSFNVFGEFFTTNIILLMLVLYLKCTHVVYEIVNSFLICFHVYCSVSSRVENR
jgi:hypothetical protein